MNIIIVGDSCESIVLGSIFKRRGAKVQHFIATKRFIKCQIDREYNINIENYYPRDLHFELTHKTMDKYKPVFVDDIVGNPDIIIFAGCYDQVVTAMKQLSTFKTNFPKSRYLIQIKNWKSVEYLKTIVGSSFNGWLTPMVEAYFDDEKGRSIKAAFIRKVGISFHECENSQKISFCKELTRFLQIDLFEVADTIDINRIVISTFTPLVLYMSRFMELHWKQHTKIVEYLGSYYEETQPYLFEYVNNTNISANMWPYINLYRHSSIKELQDLITRMGSQEMEGILPILVRSALINKYSNDEAIDLATEMIRWFKSFKISVSSLLSLFDEEREIWEFVNKHTQELEDKRKEEKTILLEKIENKK